MNSFAVITCDQIEDDRPLKAFARMGRRENNAGILMRASDFRLFTKVLNIICILIDLLDCRFEFKCVNKTAKHFVFISIQFPDRLNDLGLLSSIRRACQDSVELFLRLFDCFVSFLDRLSDKSAIH